MDAIYLPDGADRFVPTELARGPWDPGAQHGGAPAALLARAVEQAESEQPMAIVRLTYELLRPVPLTPLELRTHVVRPGRRVQLIEASLVAAEQEVCRLTALRIRVADVPVEPSEEAGPPSGPEQHEEDRSRADWGVSFASAGMEIRFAEGEFIGVGPAFAWFRLRVPLVAGEQPTPLQRLAAAGDFGNGIAAAVPWTSHLFINPDLTLYVERLPQGEWVGLDARTRTAGAGSGVSDSVLYDERGRVGRALQSLYLAER
jgi:hypothetical protein